MLLAGAIVGFLAGDELSKFISPILYAVGAVAITATFVFSYNFLRASARIYSDQQREINSLKEQLKPTLQIEFKEDDDTFYYESPLFHELEELFDNRSSHKSIKYWRLCRIAVRNCSKTTSIENVEVKLTSIDPVPEKLKGKLPLHLHLMHDNTSPYKQRIDINPDSTQFVDIVEWIWDLEEKEPKFTIYHSVADIDANFPIGDYKIRIEVSGRNATCEPKSFHIGMRNKDGITNKLWMSESPL